MPSWIYGKNSIREVLKAGRRKIQKICVVAQASADDELYGMIHERKIPLERVGAFHLDSLTGRGRHQGIAAEVGPFPYGELAQAMSHCLDEALFLVCDSIHDPQNFGAICRSAYCFGVDAIILPKDRSVEITPVVTASSAGAVERLNIIKVTNLARTLGDLKKDGFWIYAADPHAPDTISDVTPSRKRVLLVGSEGRGVRPLVLKNCDFRVKIAMRHPFNSLNVAQAATILLYEMSKTTGDS